jgi:hypothetical protein
MDPEGADAGTAILINDTTRCPSFADLNHLNSHIQFFRDHKKMNFEQMIMDPSKGSSLYTMHKWEKGPAVKLTSLGLKALHTMCKATTAFGKLRETNKDGMSGMKVEDHVTSTGAAAAGTLTDPQFKLLQSRTTGDTGDAAATVLDGESTFEKLDGADKEEVFYSSKGPVAVEVGVSTALMTLFYHGGMCVKKGQPKELCDQHIPRNTCGPPMNTRAITNMKRLFDRRIVARDEAMIGEGSATVMSDEAGLVATALGKGRGGNSFREHPFYIVAYSVADGTNANRESAGVRSNESVMDLPNKSKGPAALIDRSAPFLGLGVFRNGGGENLATSEVHRLRSGSDKGLLDPIGNHGGSVQRVKNMSGLVQTLLGVMQQCSAEGIPPRSRTG